MSEVSQTVSDKGAGSGIPVVSKVSLFCMKFFVREHLN